MQGRIQWIWLAVLLQVAGSAALGGPSEELAEKRLAVDPYNHQKLREADGISGAVIRLSLAPTRRETGLGISGAPIASCLNQPRDLMSLGLEPFAQRTQTLCRPIPGESVMGNSQIDLAASLNRQANHYADQALYSRAEPLYLRELAILEEVLGPKHPGVAAALTHLANLYNTQGFYARAEPLYQNALATLEETRGPEHPDVAVLLNNLALIYKAQGAYTRAEPLYERALAIDELALGRDHPDTAQTLNNLANLLSAQGLYARAEPLYERALSIQELVLGDDHPDLAQTLNNLANLLNARGLYARAEPLYERALDIAEAALGERHPGVAPLLNNLANLYRAQGMYAYAGPLYERALAIEEKALGKDHPSLALSLNNLAMFRLVQGRSAEALRLFTRALSVSEQRLRHEALYFSEARLTHFLQHLRTDEERLYSLLRAHPEDEDVQHLALSAVLLLKGRSVEAMADTSRSIYRGLGTQDRNTFERLREVRSQLAALSLRGAGSRTQRDHQLLEGLSRQAEALEASLAKRSAALRAHTVLPSPEEIVSQIAAALPRDGALVEFIAYRDSPLLENPVVPAPKPTRQLRYLAVVLLPHAEVRAIDLGPAESIDRAASNLREALARRDAAFEAPAQALYQLAFQPLLPLLGDIRRVFISPDGQLGLVPFAAMHDGHQFLVNSFDFTYLTSGRDLLPRPQELESPRSVVVLADPNFNSPLRVPPSALAQAPELAVRSATPEGFLSSLRADVAAQPWTPLPGTRQEAEAIQRLIPQAQLFLGPEATRERLLSLPTPAILHLATHGFFLEDSRAPTASRAIGSFGVLGEAPSALRLPDPLLRSGLVLAGDSALPADPSSPTPPQPGNTWVTALELAGLNLWGTELVVMSACDTGRGDVKLGQGVYGLRRAFVVAGAETVVMSLWKVNDDTTRVLMEAYYRNLLTGQGRATALREAMRWVSLIYPHPHYWAPFIALGRDAPLRALAPAHPAGAP
jgi:CHAT domain-containing protein/Tfp pilus assembly protein PilF